MLPQCSLPLQGTKQNEARDGGGGKQDKREKPGMIDWNKMRRHESREERKYKEDEDSRMSRGMEGVSQPEKKCDRRINKRLSMAAFNPLCDCNTRPTPCMGFYVNACLPDLCLCECGPRCRPGSVPDYMHYMDLRANMFIAWLHIGLKCKTDTSVPLIFTVWPLTG